MNNDFDYNFEVIIVDSSTDNSCDIIDKNMKTFIYTNLKIENTLRVPGI